MAKWERVSTGGGCEALQLNLPGGAYLWLTRSDDPSIPEDDAEPVMLGLYCEDGECVAVTIRSSKGSALARMDDFIAKANTLTPMEWGMEIDNDFV